MANTSEFVDAPDGLKLHVGIYGETTGDRLPVVCLPGLSRNGSDFRDLAEALATHPEHPRRVLTIDLRGRGRSDRDPNPANYNPATELGDVIGVLAALDAEPAIFVGTSRGGILTMLMAAVRPAAIAGAVLNDIGPVIDLKGLMRIKGYVGRTAQPGNFEDGAAILQALHGAHFPAFTASDWLEQARRTWQLDGGTLIPSYDPALAKTLDGVAPDKPLPDLWTQFDALPDVPLMVIRGQHSDLLRPATIAAMKQRRPALRVLEIEGEGHAPRLEGSVIAHIAALAERCDETRA